MDVDPTQLLRDHTAPVDRAVGDRVESASSIRVVRPRIELKSIPMKPRGGDSESRLHDAASFLQSRPLPAADLVVLTIRDEALRNPFERPDP
jgi:hypothetical protein